MRVSFALFFIGCGVVAAAVPFACGPILDFEPPGIAFRCSPSGPEPNCPVGYLCCSDDPAAQEGDLPGYAGRAPGNVPLFSGLNNTFSATGMCIQDGLLAPGGGLIEPGVIGCPVPCNPHWAGPDVESVCGPNTICCQTVEMGPRDCVLDDECWRPATGDDVFASDVQGPWGEGPDPWAAATHDTHQDPGGTGCRAFAQGDPAAEQDCIMQLSVADQRGFCLTLSEQVQLCPLEDPSYIDPCERRNLEQGRDCD